MNDQQATNAIVRSSTVFVGTSRSSEEGTKARKGSRRRIRNSSLAAAEKAIVEAQKDVWVQDETTKAYRCLPCDLSLRNIVSLQRHLQGKKHVSTLAQAELRRKLCKETQWGGKKSNDLVNQREVWDITSEGWKCRLCQTGYLSLHRVQRHLGGKKHAAALSRRQRSKTGANKASLEQNGPEVKQVQNESETIPSIECTLVESRELTEGRINETGLPDVSRSVRASASDAAELDTLGRSTGDKAKDQVTSNNADASIASTRDLVGVVRAEECEEASRYPTRYDSVHEMILLQTSKRQTLQTSATARFGVLVGSFGTTFATPGRSTAQIEQARSNMSTPFAAEALDDMDARYDKRTEEIQTRLLVASDAWIQIDGMSTGQSKGGLGEAVTSEDNPVAASASVPPCEREKERFAIDDSTNQCSATATSEVNEGKEREEPLLPSAKTARFQILRHAPQKPSLELRVPSASWQPNLDCPFAAEELASTVHSTESDPVATRLLVSCDSVDACAPRPIRVSSVNTVWSLTLPSGRDTGSSLLLDPNETGEEDDFELD